MSLHVVSCTDLRLYPAATRSTPIRTMVTPKHVCLETQALHVRVPSQLAFSLIWCHRFFPHVHKGRTRASCSEHAALGVDVAFELRLVLTRRQPITNDRLRLIEQHLHSEVLQ